MDRSLSDLIAEYEHYERAATVAVPTDTTYAELLARLFPTTEES